MFPMDKFLISKRPYAADLASFRSTWHEYKTEGRRPEAPKGVYRNDIRAAWFRRRRGLTVACIGYLWYTSREQVPDGESFMLGHADGRYGGEPQGRWDGESYWGTGTLEDQERHLAVLNPMLWAYPDIPRGFNGWWTFTAPTPTPLRHSAETGGAQ